jgi:hypothetical protein
MLGITFITVLINKDYLGYGEFIRSKFFSFLVSCKLLLKLKKKLNFNIVEKFYEVALLLEQERVRGF